MYKLHILAIISCSVVAAAFASCDYDNCYKAVRHHHNSGVPGFCKSYIDSHSVAVPSDLASYNPSRISSACSCLLTTTTTTATPTFASISSTTFNPSTCDRHSIAACPTPYDPCCAYICAEAQVPFQVCSPADETVLAQCSKCPSPTTPSITPTTQRNATSSTTTSPQPTSTQTTLSASTCTGRLLSTPACPTPYDPCCAWNCEEAQVPYNVCSQTDGSGEYATCTQCPSPPPS